MGQSIGRRNDHPAPFSAGLLPVLFIEDRDDVDGPQDLRTNDHTASWDRDPISKEV
jgi:hypothetical protein